MISGFRIFTFLFTGSLVRNQPENVLKINFKLKLDELFVIANITKHMSCFLILAFSFFFLYEHVLFISLIWFWFNIVICSIGQISAWGSYNPLLVFICWCLLYLATMSWTIMKTRRPCITARILEEIKLLQ